MPWCPKCKYEYKEGITNCADCGCELVDDLSFVEEKNIKQDIKEMEAEFKESLLKASEEFNLEYDESVDEFEKAVQKEINEPLIYVNNEEKAEENKTSAYTLLMVGSIGLILVVLFFFDILPINLPTFNKYMISGVMGAMFILFIVMGGVSIKNFRLFKDKAEKENKLTDSIKDWVVRNYTKEIIDENFDFSEVQEEIKYFQRIQFLKSAIGNQFMNLDEAYLNRLTDELYSEIFEL